MKALPRHDFTFGQQACVCVCGPWRPAGSAAVRPLERTLRDMSEEPEAMQVPSGWNATVLMMPRGSLKLRTTFLELRSHTCVRACVHACMCMGVCTPAWGRL